jgi:transcriptional regulator with XRE-family HTH domain
VLSDDTARHVVALRKAAGLTREELAERCAALGFPSLTTAALGNVETGRRDAEGRRRREITVEEWLVLAYALDVPPLMLLLPPDADNVELTSPRRTAPVADVAAWIRGDVNLSGDQDAQAYVGFRLYVRAHELARELRTLLGQWGPANADGAQDRPPGWDGRYRVTVKELEKCRRDLRAFEQRPPALPRGLEWVDQAGTDPDSEHGS